MAGVSVFRKGLPFWIAAAVLSVAGCAKSVTIRTRPSGAKVFVGHREPGKQVSGKAKPAKYVGLSPVSVAWDSRQVYTVKAIVGGFFPKEETFYFPVPPPEITIIFDEPIPLMGNGVPRLDD